jgi:spore coat polysaccharide biosynthesis protein SpsF (cytidylyltransferase family)
MLNINNFGIIIEARTGSNRFKKKILKKIYKKTSVLEFLIKRIKNQKKIKKIIVATTTNNNDDIIEQICKKNKIKCFRGSEKNLIKRVSDAAKFYKLSHIVQATSDNPFFDITIFKKLLKVYMSGKYDFASNSLIRTYPIGSDIRIFSVKKLISTSHTVIGIKKQHTCYYFLKNFKKLKYFNLYASKKYIRPNIRITIDFKEDLKLLKIIVSKLGPKKINLLNIIQFLDKNPKLKKLNSKHPTHYE